MVVKIYHVLGYGRFFIGGNYMYKYPIALTQQFRFCGNPFRVDLYKGCDFGCKYCFANSRNGGFRADFDEAGTRTHTLVPCSQWHSQPQFSSVQSLSHVRVFATP